MFLLIDLIKNMKVDWHNEKWLKIASTRVQYLCRLCDMVAEKVVTKPTSENACNALVVIKDVICSILHNMFLFFRKNVCFRRYDGRYLHSRSFPYIQ